MSVVTLERMPQVYLNTPRRPPEREIVRMIEMLAYGATHLDLETELHLSGNGVNSRLRKLFDAFGIASSAGLVAVALRRRWIAPIKVTGEARRPSEAQLQVLQMYANGMTQPVIMRKLSITYYSADSLRMRAVRALEASNLPHAVAIAITRGLIK